MFSKVDFDVAVIRAGSTKEAVADMLGINKATLYRKICGYSDFRRDEIQKITEFLGLSLVEKENIFFKE